MRNNLDLASLPTASNEPSVSGVSRVSRRFFFFFNSLHVCCSVVGSLLHHKCRRQTYERQERPCRCPFRTHVHGGSHPQSLKSLADTIRAKHCTGKPQTWGKLRLRTSNISGVSRYSLTAPAPIGAQPTHRRTAIQQLGPLPDRGSRTPAVVIDFPPATTGSSPKAKGTRSSMPVSGRISYALIKPPSPTFPPQA